jgi:hypothetical protein
VSERVSESDERAKGLRKMKKSKKLEALHKYSKRASIIYKMK